MRKFIILGLLSLFGLYSLAAQHITIEIEGPETEYNQVRVVNGTSQENFRCRVVRLTTEGKQGETFAIGVSDEEETEVGKNRFGEKVRYGVYYLKEKGDSDSKTNWVYQGDRFMIDLPKDFPVEVSYTIEYKNLPLFDVVIIHLFDTNEFDD